MKVIKNINNNVSLCLDDNNNELIAFGKGLGFKQPPYEIDLGVITRTFYDVDHRYFDLLNIISDEIFEVSAKIVDYARSKINAELNPNIVFTLADHIQFAVKRHKDKMKLKFKMSYDLMHFHSAEVQVGRFAVQLVNKEINVDLPEDEVYGIALHFINAESMVGTQGISVSNEEFIKEVVNIIEREFDIKIDYTGFNYSRFASHMEYLLERVQKGKQVISGNLAIFDSLRGEFPQIYKCANLINQYFEKELGWKLSDEEVFYLMLHINRLCAREDCYQ